MKNIKLNDIVVCFREHNDADHLTPIIDFIAKTGKYNIVLFLINKDYENFSLNPNILYLSSKHNIAPIDFIGEIKSIKSTRFIYRIIENIEAYLSKIRNSTNIFHNVYLIMAVLVLKLAYRLVEAVSNKTINRYANNILFGIFDTGSNSINPNRIIHKNLKLRNIPRIIIHHGLHSFINEDYSKKTKLFKRWETIALKNYKDFIRRLWFNAYLWSNKKDQLNADLYILPGKHINHPITQTAAGYKPELSVEIASLRFTYEWNAIYKREVIKEIYKRNSKGKLKLLYFVTPKRFNIKEKEVLDMLSFIANRDDVDLVVKPFTRQYRIDDYINLFCDKNGIKMEFNVQSVSLINWSDVVMSSGSSIEIQALIDNKALLHLSYQSENNSIFQSYSSCFSVCNLSELDNIISKLVIDKNYKSYSCESVNNLMNDIVYNNNDRKDVFNFYYNYIIKFVHSYYAGKL